MSPDPAPVRAANRVAIAVLAATAALALAALVVIPALDLASPGRILAWHIAQPSYREGALEAVVLYGVVLAGFAAGARAGFAIVVLGTALYLRRHHVDLPALVALAYFEAMLAAGLLGLRALRAPAPAAANRMLQFVAGVCVVSVVLLASSLAGYGRPRDLAVVGAVMVLATLLLARAEPASVQLVRAVTRLSPAARASAVALLTWMIVLLVRTNHTFGYDPLWYGLRPEYVLAPERSLFDETGLVAQVFYYPKLYELLLMPLSAASDFSFPLAFGVFVLAFLSWLAFDLSRRLGAGVPLALAAAALVATIPAISNVSLNPKPDLFAGLLIVIASACFHRGLVRREGSALAYGAAAAALSFQAKLVAIPYAGVLLLATSAIALFMRRRADPARWTRPDGAALATLATAAAISIALTARTIMLAGLPTIGPDVLMPLWSALGFEMRDPVGTVGGREPQSLHEWPALIADLLLYPSRLQNILITWIGNAWLWLAAFAFAAALVLRRRPVVDATAVALVLPVLTLGAMLLFGVDYQNRGGDGNYLIAPLALGSILTVVFAADAMRGVRVLERTACAGIAVAALFHVLYSFANASWAQPGTRTLDFDLTRSPIDTRHVRRDALVVSGLAEFEEYLRRSPRLLRVVGYVPQEEQAYWLTARYEALGNLNFMRPDLVFNPDGFAHFLRVARIDIVLLPKRFDEKVHSPVVIEYLARLEREGKVEVHDFGEFRAFVLPGS